MDEITPAAFRALLHRVAARIDAEQGHLSELDRATGDGDHGSTMAGGWRAAVAAMDAAPADAGFQALCNAGAKAFVNSVGGSAGPLYAAILMRGGAAVKDRAALDRTALTAFLDAALQGLRDRGRAEAGDKTMMDAWIPAVAALHASQDGTLAAGMAAAAEAAEAGARATRDMVARIGRASRLGERARGHVDPGAQSSALFFRVLADGVAG